MLLISETNLSTPLGAVMAMKFMTTATLLTMPDVVQTAVPKASPTSELNSKPSIPNLSLKNRFTELKW